MVCRVRPSGNAGAERVQIPDAFEGGLQLGLGLDQAENGVGVKEKVPPPCRDAGTRARTHASSWASPRGFSPDGSSGRPRQQYFVGDPLVRS